MRARNIKPAFFQNEVLTEIDPFGRLLFIGLWCLADRKGRLEDRPKRIKMQLFALDNVDVVALLDDLEQNDFIQRYTVNGNNYIQITNFAKHQRPHSNESASEIPDPMVSSDPSKYPDESSENTTPSHQGEQDLQPRCEALRPDTGYLIPDVLIPDTESSLAPAKPSRKSAEPRARPRNETWDALAALCGEPETTSEKSDFGKTVKELREANATPQEIAAFGPWWFEKHPDAELTHHCLRRHLGRFRNQPERPPPPVSSIRNPMVRAALTTDLSDIRAELESKRDRRNEIQGPFSGPRELPAES